MASAAAPGAYLVEIIPAMIHLPKWLAQWKREGIKWHEEETEMLQDLNAGVAESMASFHEDFLSLISLIWDTGNG